MNSLFDIIVYNIDGVLTVSTITQIHTIDTMKDQEVLYLTAIGDTVAPKHVKRTIGNLVHIKAELEDKHINYHI